MLLLAKNASDRLGAITCICLGVQLEFLSVHALFTLCIALVRDKIYVPAIAEQIEL